MSRLAKHAALTEVRSCPGDQRRTDLALFVLHAVAIATFTRGFLLTRVELPNTSGCSDADGISRERNIYPIRQLVELKLRRKSYRHWFTELPPLMLERSCIPQSRCAGDRRTALGLRRIKVEKESAHASASETNKFMMLETFLNRP
eukprot:1094088-Prorocentrum_minimum.AAC.3